MKKNKMTRAASVLLVLVLVTTSFLAGVLAKYVITDGATDTARVAKFGVVTSVEGTLFGTSYQGGTASPSNTIQAWGAHSESVSSRLAADTNGNGTTAATAENVVAPGTKNDKGMTLSVSGTPEVSTRIIIDAPEGDGTTDGSGIGGTDNKDFANTDIYLNDGAYYIMQKVAANAAAASPDDDLPVVTITADNMADYYSLTAGSGTASGTFAPLSAVPADSAVVYKAIQLTGVNEASTMADSQASNTASNHNDGHAYVWHDSAYYPIQWKVDGTALTGTGSEAVSKEKNSVDGVYSALTSKLTGTKEGTAYKTANIPPNTDIKTLFGTSGSGKSTVTWEWVYGNAWSDVSGNDNTLQNWENTTLEDLADTVLGEMIAAQADTSQVDYAVAKMVGNTLTEIKYTEVEVSETSANKAIYAYAGSIPTAASKTDVTACLTVTFGARITVEQVD